MKDYYYILGIKESATPDEIKYAFRKLSLKFHPDKNDGDPFFAERFKDILEAYEILSEKDKRNEYDLKRNQSSSSQNKNYNTSNFSPEIEFFSCGTNSYEFDQAVTFRWKTINADKVTIKPFGTVEAIGTKVYKIKDFKNSHLTFELIAENTIISRQKKATITLVNETYAQLKKHFKEQFEKEATIEANKRRNQRSNSSNIDKESQPKKENDYTTLILWIFVSLIIWYVFWSITK